MAPFRVALLVAVLVVAVVSLDLDATKKTAHKAKGEKVKARAVPHKSSDAEHHKRAAVKQNKKHHPVHHAKGAMLHDLEADQKLAHLETELESGLADVKYVESMVQNTEEKLNSALHDVQTMMQVKATTTDEPPEAAELEPEPAEAADEPADAAEAELEQPKPNAADAEPEPEPEPEAAEAEPEPEAAAELEAEAEPAPEDAAAEDTADKAEDDAAEEAPDAETPAEDDGPEMEALDSALEGEEDLEAIALLQEDDMNDGAEEMIMAPRSRPLRLMQQADVEDQPPATLVDTANKIPTPDNINDNDKTFTFAANVNGGTADVTSDGQIIPKKAFSEQDAPRQGVDTTGDLKASPDDADNVDAELAKTGLAVPGGSPPSPPSSNNTDPNDVVCMCKRQGAPKKMKGHDRVKCKRHVKPTPTPEPPVEGIRQCVTGPWAGVTGSTQDANTTDTICIYFPARLPTPAEVAPEREWPDECYDDRNEFLAEGVKKRPWDQFLLQEGYEAHHFESCGCGM